MDVHNAFPLFSTYETGRVVVTRCFGVTISFQDRIYSAREKKTSFDADEDDRWGHSLAETI